MPTVWRSGSSPSNSCARRCWATCAATRTSVPSMKATATTNGGRGMFAIAPAAAFVGQWLQSFREFPPRQKELQPRPRDGGGDRLPKGLAVFHPHARPPSPGGGRFRRGGSGRRRRVRPARSTSTSTTRVQWTARHLRAVVSRCDTPIAWQAKPGRRRQPEGA